MLRIVKVVEVIQAAIRAGYSKKTAEWIGPQLLTKTHVSEAIQAAMDKRGGIGTECIQMLRRCREDAWK